MITSPAGTLRAASSVLLRRVPAHDRGIQAGRVMARARRSGAAAIVGPCRLGVRPFGRDIFRSGKELPQIHKCGRIVPEAGVEIPSWILWSLYVFGGASPGRLRGRTRCGAGGTTLITTARCRLRGHQGSETLPLLCVFVPSTAEQAEGTTSWRLPLSRRRWWTSSPA